MANRESAGGTLIGNVTSYRNIAGVSGNVAGSWNRGLSAYEVAVQNGFQGTISEWLDSLKGEAITIKQIEEDENLIYLTFSDNTLIRIPKGSDGLQTRVYIQKTEVNEYGDTVITFSDRSTILVPKGAPGVSPTFTTNQVEEGYRLNIKDVNGTSSIVLRHGDKGEQGEIGPQGEPGENGREIELKYEDGIIYWHYIGDEEWQEVININQMAHNEFTQLFNDNHPVRVVTQLPEIDDAEEGVMYVLKEEVE